MRIMAQVFGVVGITCLVLSGCTSGRVTIAPPTAELSTSPPITLARSRQDVWKIIVPKLSQTFFVINTIDQSSGLINVSYSGDPEQFVDCGRVTSYVKNARGERTYEFAGAKASQQYEVMTGSDLFHIDRTVALEGRANLVLEDIAASTTRVSVNVRYVLSKTVRFRGVMGNETIDRSSISFSSGGKASFAANSNGEATTCQPTGALERQLLALSGG
jgi:hypothetical protein